MGGGVGRFRMHFVLRLEEKTEIPGSVPSMKALF
jgi:hypothetical protein